MMFTCFQSNVHGQFTETLIENSIPPDLVIEMVYQGRAETKSTHLRSNGQPRRLDIHSTPAQ